MDQIMSISPSLIAKHLLTIKAVDLNVQNPFTYSSGLKGPIYCDNRLTLSYPETRKLLVNAFIEQYKQLKLNVDIIGGIATGGIAYAAYIAEALNLPMIYIRSSAKGHGKKRAVEGVLKANSNVLLIEDLVTTGNSALKAAQAALDESAMINHCFSIFTYNLNIANTAFAQQQISLNPLCDLDCLLSVALDEKYINEQEYQSIKQWQLDPTTWAKNN